MHQAQLKVPAPPAPRAVDVGCGYVSYAQLMDEHRPYITITLDLSDPIELTDFIDLFASLSSQYRRYIKNKYPKSNKEAKIFVKEVRKGSIIADLIPTGDLIQLMDEILIVVGFSGLVAKIISSYAKGKRVDTKNKSEVNDFLGTVRGVARDSDGKAIIETAVYKQGVWSKEVVFQFTTTEAKEAVKYIESHKSDLDKTTTSDYERELMYFKRSDIGDAAVGEKSGERVIIESISEKDLPLIYASQIAEDVIKNEIRNSEENIYKKGFVVDVNLLTKGAKNAGYAVTHVHQIIDLPVEETDSQSQ